MVTRTVKTEFPDYAEPLPSLPGFSDGSWHNDSCPCLRSEDGDGNSLTVFCDYADPDRREIPGMPRYSVHNDDDGCLFESDDWDATVEFIRTIRPE